MKIVVIVVSFISSLVFYVLYSHYSLEQDKIKIQSHHDMNTVQNFPHNVDAYSVFLKNYSSSGLKDSMVESPMYIPPDIPSSSSLSNQAVGATSVMPSAVLDTVQSQQERQHEI